MLITCLSNKASIIKTDIMRKTITLALIVYSSSIICQNVDIKRATDVALCYMDKVAELQGYNYSFVVDTIIFNYYNDILCYYTICFQEGGYTNIAATDASIPIISYSFSHYKLNRNSSPAYLDWINDYKKELYLIITSKLDNSNTIDKWNNILTYSNKSKDVIVGPLTTSEWGQSVDNGWNCPGYNLHMPTNTECLCGRCPAGCVAIAMAQILYYWEHPIHDNWFYSYYDWCNMQNTLDGSNEYELNAVSKLVWDCAESVDMNYCKEGTCSSGAYTEDIVTVIGFQFGYHNDVNYKTKSGHSWDTWEEFIRDDLDNGQPIIYRSKNDDGNGHAFICDGYQIISGDEKFHFNWGWNGIDNDEWLYLGTLNTSNGNYNNDHGAIFHIKPDPGSTSDYCSLEIDLFLFYVEYYWQAGFLEPWEIVPNTAQILYSCDESGLENWKTIPSGESSVYTAHEKIILRPGFKAEQGSNFIAQITPCPNCESKEATVDTEHHDKISSKGKNKESFGYENYDVGQQNEIKVYPNPNQGNFIVEIPDNFNNKVSVEVYNIRGEMIFKQEYQSTSTIEVSINSQIKGTYLLKINSGSYKLIHTKKIVIQ